MLVPVVLAGGRVTVPSHAENAATVREALLHTYRNVETPAFFALDELPSFAALDALVAQAERAADYKADRDSYDELLGRKMAERDEWHNRAVAAEARVTELEGALTGAQFCLTVEYNRYADSEPTDPTEQIGREEGMEIIGETLNEIAALIGPYFAGKVAALASVRSSTEGTTVPPAGDSGERYEWFVYDPVSNNVLGEHLTREAAQRQADELNALNPDKQPVEVLAFDGENAGDSGNTKERR